MTGLDILHAIQSLQSTFLDQFFYIVTQVHHEVLYFVVLPVAFWFYDKRFGRYLTSVLAVGFWVNGVLKFSFNTARPSPSVVRVLHPETAGGPAFPSGHSQSPLMFWGALALQFRRPWFTWLAAVLVLLIGVSRLYLGVHWPLDVLGGWVIGALLLTGFEASRAFWGGEKPQGGGSSRLSAQLLWAAAIPLAMTATGLAMIPASMSQNVWVLGGIYLGFWVGAVLEDEFVGFDPRSGGPLVQVAKLIVGAALVLGVKEGLKPFLSTTGVSHGIRYACVGLMASFGAPWAFHRLTASPSAGKSDAG